MCANFLSGNVSELVGYTYPKLHKGKDWYVDFYARDPVTNKMRSKKYWIASEFRLTETWKYGYGDVLTIKDMTCSYKEDKELLEAVHEAEPFLMPWTAQT